VLFSGGRQAEPFRRPERTSQKGRTFVFKRISLVVYSALLSCSAMAQQAVDYQSLVNALSKAQQEAIHRGDEKLDCPALEQQLIAAVTAPSVQAYVEKAGEQAQRDQAQAKPDPAKMTAQGALAAFSSLVPGGAWAGMMAGVAEMSGMQAQTAANLQQRVQQTNDMVKILPQLLRGQRVIELAQQRGCEWVPAEVMQPDGAAPGAK
jgi:hypothetical protein